MKPEGLKVGMRVLTARSWTDDRYFVAKVKAVDIGGTELCDVEFPNGEIVRRFPSELRPMDDTSDDENKA